MKILKTINKNFYNDLEIYLQKRSQQNIPNVDKTVKKIIFDIVDRGDEALFEYVSKMAEVENLEGHKLSVKIRKIEKKKI